MDFGPFVVLSLIYAVLGVRVVVELVRRWRETWDDRFTPRDRALVTEAAFYVLVPVSVALHELGHAVAIWGFGGRVLGWGYFGFAGYVEFNPQAFTPTERIVIALAGTIVNLALAGAAVALVFGRRPPMRAAFNELLVRFTQLSLLNALVVYPALDLLAEMDGDWSQIYRGGVPALSGAILVVHVGILALLLWSWRDDRFRARVVSLTGAGPPVHRLNLGSAGAAEAPARGVLATPEAALREAASRVASGWPVPLDGALQRRANGLLLMLTWPSAGSTRSLVAWAPASGGVQLTGVVATAGNPPTRWAIVQDPSPLDPDRLTLALRIALETVENRAVDERTAGPADR
jgi:hypothetical protein